MQITGNTIVITGGGSGIGRALAESFLRFAADNGPEKYTAFFKPFNDAVSSSQTAETSS